MKHNVTFYLGSKSSHFAGLTIAKQIEISDFPRFVAAFHSLVGLAAGPTYIAEHMSEYPHLDIQPSADVLKIWALYWSATFAARLVAYEKPLGTRQSVI